MFSAQGLDSLNKLFDKAVNYFTKDEKNQEVETTVSENTQSINQQNDIKPKRKVTQFE